MAVSCQDDSESSAEDSEDEEGEYDAEVRCNVVEIGK